MHFIHLKKLKRALKCSETAQLVKHRVLNYALKLHVFCSVSSSCPITRPAFLPHKTTLHSTLELLMQDLCWVLQLGAGCLTPGGVGRRQGLGPIMEISCIYSQTPACDDSDARKFHGKYTLQDLRNALLESEKYMPIMEIFSIYSHLPACDVSDAKRFHKTNKDICGNPTLQRVKLEHWNIGTDDC